MTVLGWWITSSISSRRSSETLLNLVDEERRVFFERKGDFELRKLRERKTKVTLRARKKTFDDRIYGASATALRLIQEYRPDGTESLLQLTELATLKARERPAYVGDWEFSVEAGSDAMHKVALLWKEGQTMRTALWVVDTSTSEIHPQGDEAHDFPDYARRGGAPPPK